MNSALTLTLLSLKPIFVFFFDCPETSADLANIDSFGVSKRLTRPVATRAKDHAVSLGVNPFTYGCPFHCDPPLRAQRVPSTTYRLRVHHIAKSVAF